MNGCVSAEYVSLAWNEDHVREMAEEQGVNLGGYTLEGAVLLSPLFYLLNYEKRKIIKFS